VADHPARRRGRADRYWLAALFGVRFTGGIDWIRHFLQIAAAAVLIAIVAPYGCDGAPARASNRPRWSASQAAHMGETQTLLDVARKGPTAALQRLTGPACELGTTKPRR
jgi:hypothetical protein